MFAVNIADDFTHLGHISPDIDSLTYALAEQNNQELGWVGLARPGSSLKSRHLGGENWFRLGDKDMALHMRRTGLLNDGTTLTAATVK